MNEHGWKSLADRGVDGAKCRYCGLVASNAEISREHGQPCPALDTGDPVASEKFASHFAVTSTHGRTQIRYVDVSVAACERWAAEQLAQGHTVSHVRRFDGDNVFSLEDARKEQTQ